MAGPFRADFPVRHDWMLRPPADRANLCFTDNEPLARWLVADYVSHFGAWRGLPGLKGLQYRRL
ncbi:MAG TPA: hypothetical protein PKA74_19410, partial [Bauldia sp.]|nr:hypothetical protein [Bauldia sp.]